MKEMEEEDEREQNALRSQIARLEGDVKEYERNINEYSQQMRVLERQLNQERDARTEVQRELAKYQGEDMPLDVVPLPPRKKPLVAQQQPLLDVHTNGIPAEEATLGCGRCTIDTRCECFERAVDLANSPTENTGSAAKRPHSPSQHGQNKRARNDRYYDLKPETDLEIDFTTRYAPQSSASAPPPRPAATPTQGYESCGFCQDGTACLCAELAEDAKASATAGSNSSQLLSNASKRSADTAAAPGPAYPYPSLSISSPCANGPGTCLQCRNSPTSMLFCKSLVATRSDTSKDSHQLPTPHNSNSTPCGNPSGCCRTQPPKYISPISSSNYSHLPILPQTSSPLPANPVRGPTLTCADAFMTLARHPDFDRATDELDAWIPKLMTVPKEMMKGRTAYEVEAASVMGVLKYFDRRFGGGC